MTASVGLGQYDALQDHLDDSVGQHVIGYRNDISHILDDASMKHCEQKNHIPVLLEVLTQSLVKELQHYTVQRINRRTFLNKDFLSLRFFF